MREKKTDSEDKQGASKPLSLHPLSPEEALRRFMEVDPKKYEEHRRREERKKG